MIANGKQKAEQISTEHDTDFDFKNIFKNFVKLHNFKR